MSNETGFLQNQLYDFIGKQERAIRELKEEIKKLKAQIAELQDDVARLK